jgi:hypothetical protein
MKKNFFKLFFLISLIYLPAIVSAKIEMRIVPVNIPLNVVYLSGHVQQILMSENDSLEMRAYFREEEFTEPMDSVRWFLNGIEMGLTQDIQTMKFGHAGIISAVGYPYSFPAWLPAKDTVFLSFEAPSGIQNNVPNGVMEIFPTAVNSMIQLKFENEKQSLYAFTIYDPIGKIVYEEKKEIPLGLSFHSIDVSILPASMYFLTFYSEERHGCSKFFKSEK